MPGAWSETKNATDEIQKICDQVKGPVEAIADRKYTVYRAVKYRSQLVAGENFLIKVDVGEDYDHLSVYRKLPCDGGEVVLRGVEQHRTKDAPLVPFTN
ncbi:cystatin-B-like [Epinephelus lanceolatus]|uniref:cystatin-B-like isoform X2 n=1 Tax=Epinephelus lanceolatus TaxID=310571 RepID=UPI001445786A|nr:cystatin-B-like isoform X2 [Epinephelus lanceolatus]XP_033495105.1 cystatin-B-like isoform X2 [Epinephelus lanceolatus]XP_033495106.1 cystatin-B-like isoform X2 [Epinephelus lanceolatus]